MNDLDYIVREAFDAVELPAKVRSRTLAAIDGLAARPEPGKAPSFAASGSAGAQDSRACQERRPSLRLTRWRRAAIALAACLALAIIGVGGAKLYFDETAYIGIDINPSIELGINRFDIVVSAAALNGDGEKLLASGGLEGRRYDEAIATLTASESFAPYASADTFVEISVTSASTRQADELRAQSDACLRGLSGEGACHVVDESLRSEAKAVGMGSGRYRAALQLLELDSSVTLDDCASMSMRELRDRIAAAGGPPSSAQGQGSESEACGSGQGKGHMSGRGRRGES